MSHGVIHRAILTGLVGFSFQIRPTAGLPQIPATSARAVALGGAAVALEGVDGVYMNPGALVGIESTSMNVGMSRPFGLAELDARSVEGVHPLGSIVGTVRLEGFGFEDFKSVRLATAVGFRVKDLGIGFRTRVTASRFGDYGGMGGVSFDAGWVYPLPGRLTLGGSIANLGRSVDDGGIAAAAGFTVRRSDLVLLAAAVIMRGQMTSGLRAGVEVSLVNELAIRMGLSINPSTATIGIGMATRRLRIDLAFTHHPRLGVSPVLTIGLFKPHNG